MKEVADTFEDVEAGAAEDGGGDGGRSGEPAAAKRSSMTSDLQER